MVMVSSETVHVRNVFNSKIVYAFFIFFSSFLLLCFCLFFNEKIKNVTDFLFVDLTSMLIHLNSSS